MEDVSSTIITNDCKNMTSFDEIFTAAGSINPGYPCFNYTLPKVGFIGGMILSLNGNISLSNGDFNKGFFPGMQVLSLTPSLVNTPSLLTSHLMFQPDLSASIISSLSSPEAYALTLDLCVQEYESSTSSGKTNTILLSSQIIPVNETETLLNENTVANFTGGNACISIDNVTFGITASGTPLLVNTMESYLVDLCFEPIIGSEIDPNSSFNCHFASGGPFSNLLLNSTSANRLAAITEQLENMAISLTNS